MKMAKLRVIFPHRDENTGELYMPGDYREVPEHRVSFYLLPTIAEGVVCLAINPDIWKPEKAAVYPNSDTPAAFFENQPEAAPEAIAQEVVSPVELVKEQMEEDFGPFTDPDTGEVTVDDPATPDVDEAAEARAKKGRKSK